MLLDSGYKVFYILIMWFLTFIFFLRCSKTLGTHLNIFILLYFIFSIKYFFLDIFSLILTDSWSGISDRSFYITILNNTMCIIAMFTGFILVGGRYSLDVFRKNSSGYWLESALLLFFSFLCFYPIISEFGSLVITNPRSVYTQTRTGWGVSYFMAAFLLYFSLVFSLASLNATIRNAVLVAIFYSVLLLFFGSKGKILGAITLIFFWYIYFNRVKLNVFLLFIFFIVAIPISAVIVNTFTVREYSVEMSLEDKLIFATRYADYNKNQAMVLDDLEEPLYGKMIFDDFVVSKIPRIFYPEKPKDFGEFLLAKKYYPSWFYEDTGSPRFGYSMYFIDFNYFALIILPLLSLIHGVMIALTWNALKKNFNPYSFALFSLVNGVVFLSAGAGSFFIETLLFIILLYASRFGVLPKLIVSKKVNYKDVKC